MSLLLKTDYVEEMEFNIPIWRNESISFFQDPQMSWEWTKYRIREFSINFVKRIARESKREELVLREKIDKLKTLHEFNPSNETLNNLKNAIADLDSYEEKKVQGIIVRSRARWHEHGEKKYQVFSKFREKKPYS